MITPGKEFKNLRWIALSPTGSKPERSAETPSMTVKPCRVRGIQGSSSTKTIKRFNTVLLALGLAFLLYLIEKTGRRELELQFRVLGSGIILILLAEGLANLAHTVGWRHCIPRSSSESASTAITAPRRYSLWQLFRMNMAGWAINYLTPTASIGGEVTRASLLSAKCSGTDATGSVLLDKLMTAIAHLLLVIGGALFLFWRARLSMQLWIAIAITTALLTLGITAFLFLEIRGAFGNVFRWLNNHNFGSRFMEDVAQNLFRVDALLKRFYSERSRDLAISVFWHAVGHAVAIAHAWLFLTLVGQPAPVATVIGAGCLALWFDLLTFVVPLNLGTLEASRIIVLEVLGSQALLGMTFGMAIRAAQLFWACFGLASYGIFTLFTSEQTTDSPARMPRG